jgi:hypothetical protein
MPGSTKAMAVCTVVTLVLVTAYSVALGGNGWLWFGWSVLCAVTAASASRRRT